ncbi:unnamed protein product [Prunus armeniaca]
MDSSDGGVPTKGNVDEVWKLGTQLIYGVSQVQVAQQWRRLYEGRGRRRSVEARGPRCADSWLGGICGGWTYYYLNIECESEGRLMQGGGFAEEMGISGLLTRAIGKRKRSRDEGDEFMSKHPRMTLKEEDNETSLMGQGSIHRGIGGGLIVSSLKEQVKLHTPDIVAIAHIAMVF